MRFEEFLHQLTVDDRDARDPRDRALKEFADACRRVDEDPREQQRISDLADLIDAQDALYEEAIAALDRGDHERALPLLRRTAEAGIGEAAWLLAGLLEKRGQTTEAITWYQQAAADGDSRADAKLADLYSRPVFISCTLWPGNTDAYSAQPDASDHTSLEAASVIQVVSAGRPTNLLPWPAGSQRDFDFFWLPLIPAAEAGSGRGQVLALPHHGTSANWAAKLLLLVEGRSEEYTVRRLLNEYDKQRLAIVSTCSSRPADAGLDLFCALDDQMHAFQVKAVKYLRHRLRSYHKASCVTALAASLTSWQIETRATSEPTAGEVMTPLASLTTLTPSTTVHHAIEQMLQSGADALLVCDERQQVLGVVTLADLARRIHDSRGVLTIERIETVMQSPVAVAMTAPLSTVRSLMAREGTSLLAITSPTGMTVGCITIQELLAHEQSGRNTHRTDESSRAVVPLLLPSGKTCVHV